MLQYRLYDGHSLPAGLQGVMKAAANIGSVVGEMCVPTDRRLRHTI